LICFLPFCLSLFDQSHWILSVAHKGRPPLFDDD
jgi:hypothetical protein